MYTVLQKKVTTMKMAANISKKEESQKLLGINLNPIFISTSLCYNQTVVAKVRYIVSLVSSYFADLEVHFYFRSYSCHFLQLRVWSLSCGGQCIHAVVNNIPIAYLVLFQFCSQLNCMNLEYYMHEDFASRQTCELL